MLQGKIPYLSSFSAAGIVTCQFLPQQSGLIEGSDCKVSLECKEIHVILTIKHGYHPLKANACTTGIGHGKVLPKQ